MLTMTFAETLNEEACSCGLEEGCTFFTDSNGDVPKKVGEYTLLNNNNGVRVESENGGFAVSAEGPDQKTHWALFGSDYTWSDLS
ncbi:hypothetical protein N9045_01810 [bacterium]|nr:hypothetical protein [bacterium]